MDVDPHAVGDDLHFVDQSDVHRAVDVLQQLGHLGRARRAHRHHALDRLRIQGDAGLQARGGHAAHQLGDRARGTLNFFRDPERKTPARNGIIISPADGKIIITKKNISNEFVGENCSQISIFMSPLDVHVNRIPISGKVEFLKYFEGKFIAAFEDKASENNERMEIGLVTNEGNVFFTQVAGFLARRIVNELQVGDSVKIGERFGMIKFGSRVDVIAHENWTPIAKLNDNVKAGETVLFELKNK